MKYEKSLNVKTDNYEFMFCMIIILAIFYFMQKMLNTNIINQNYSINLASQTNLKKNTVEIYNHIKKDVKNRLYREVFSEIKLNSIFLDQNNKFMKSIKLNYSDDKRKRINQIQEKAHNNKKEDAIEIKNTKENKMENDMKINNIEVESNEMTRNLQEDKAMINEITSSMVQAMSIPEKKYSVLSQMFTFENQIKDAKEMVNFKKIIENNNYKVDIKNKKILIFHTHSQEMYKNGDNSETCGVIAAGDLLANELKEEYGLNVIHYKGVHDMANNTLNREGSYERIEEAISEILNDDKDIEVLIDLHRDGVPDNVKLVTDIDNKKCAKVMLVNGICMLKQNGVIKEIESLKNEYIDENIKLSINVNCAMETFYPGLTRKILVKPYRYSLHMKPNSMLIELGAQNNTFEEVQNSIKPLARSIVLALTSDK